MNPRFSISDLFVLTTLFACTLIFIDRAFKSKFSADVFANSIGHETAETFMFISLIGLIAFPIVFLAASLLVLRTNRLRFKKYFAIYFLALAILSVPFSYVVAISCARVIST